MPKEEKKNDKKPDPEKEAIDTGNKVEFEAANEINKMHNIFKDKIDTLKNKAIWFDDDISSSNKFRKYINETELLNIDQSIILDLGRSKPQNKLLDYIFESSQSLESDTTKLKKERMELLHNLRETQKQAAQHREDKEKLEKSQKEAEKNIIKLKKVNSEIQQKLALGNLISQVNDKARKKLFESEEFRSLFESVSECESYVLSIDIRRSTELMLKAKHPRLFEKFIVSLCRGLSDIIMSNYGIFDKFTGDGILSFFPDFFSGDDAGLMAIKSSIECHKFFAQHYKENRDCFVSIMQDIGLGIGLDLGDSHLVSMGGSYTVVGTPVVYACRMSGGVAGETLLNQTAFEHIFRKYKHLLNVEETSINLKHEGNFLAYKVSSNGEPMNFEEPNWDKLVVNFKKRSSL